MNYAYRLTVIGDENTLRAYEASQDCRTQLDKAWDPTQPFILRRRYFPTFPRVLRVSRKHLELQCEESSGSDGQPERNYWVTDLSTNGTWLNDCILEKGNRVPLKNGDELLIINDELSDGTRIRFGFRFTVFNESNAPQISDPPLQFITEFKEKRLRNKTKRSKEFEFSESEEDRRTSHSNGRKKPKKRIDSDNEFSSKFVGVRVKKSPFEEQRDMIVKKEVAPIIVATPKKSDRIMKQWTPEEEKKLVEVMAKSEGKSWKEIAIHFPHRSPDAVRNKFKKCQRQIKWQRVSGQLQ